MKKGFTLIELLAVIAILAVILLIAVPKIIDVVNTSRIQAYISDEKMMIKATETYLTSNMNLLPTNIGDTIEVSLNDLKDNNYISDINDQDGECNGYILVTKLEEGYSYNPQLKCGDANTIDSSEDDGLVLHYTFDDFQEPTENLISENSRLILENNNWGCYDGIGSPYHTWGTRIDYEIINKGYLENFNSMRVYNVSGETGTVGTVIWNVIEGYNEGVKFNFSVMIKGVDGGIGKNINMHRYSSNAIYGVQSTSSYTVLTGDWQKIDLSWINREGDRTNVYLLISGTDFEFEFANPQVEMKSYSTTFADGIREGIIKDYSGNSNSSELILNTTPRWIAKDNGGKYLFDGINNYVSITNNLQNILPADTVNWSYGAWAKTNVVDTTKRAIISAYDGDPGDGDLGIWLLQFQGTWQTILRGVSGLDYVNSNVSITSEWTYLFVTVSYNEGMYTIKIYVNGEEKNVASIITSHKYIDIAPLRIGAIRYGSIKECWNGYIDDVKIYNRALSSEEVQYQYNVIKYKYE